MAFLIPENLRTRRDVPPGVNRLARALQESLDDATTVWYEPLFDVSGGRPDVVVLVPDAGILVIDVLETKANAIRGVKDGRLLVEQSGTSIEVEHPLARAEASARDLRERANGDARLLPEDRLAVGAVGVFPYLSRSEAEDRSIGDAVSMARCLFRDDLDPSRDDGNALRQAISRLLDAPLRDVVSAEAETVYRALIHPDTVIGSRQLPLPTLDPRHDANDLKVLDRRQEGFAKNLGEGHRVIRGVAGSGKTLVLTYRARLLAENFPSHTILVTCFTQSLAAALKARLPLPNITVVTLDNMMERARRAADMPPLKFRDVPRDEQAQLALEALEAHPGGVPRFDHVLIDEAQDFPTLALRFAVALLREGSDSLLVVADAAQNIYRTDFTWKAAGINAQGRTRKLDVSYRSTREILDYAWAFVTSGGDLRADTDPDVDDETAVIPPQSAPRSGPLPLFLHVGSHQAEVAEIARFCKTEIDKGATPGDFAVLYGVRNAGGFRWPESLVKAFAEFDVPCRWVNDPDGNRAALLAAIASSRDWVAISTIHSAKGLEFRSVIVCGYLDHRPPEQDAILNRRLVYVGMTRATYQLVLTASGRHPYIADLEMP